MQIKVSGAEKEEPGAQVLHEGWYPSDACHFESILP